MPYPQYINAEGVAAPMHRGQLGPHNQSVGRRFFYSKSLPPQKKLKKVVNFFNQTNAIIYIYQNINSFYPVIYWFEQNNVSCCLWFYLLKVILQTLF